MGSVSTLDRTIKEIVRRDPRYTAGAYDFIFEVIDYAAMHGSRARQRQDDRHLSVVELLDNTRRYAIEQYGPLAQVVLEFMGIDTTDDIGELVFNLVDVGLLNKSEGDERSQFANVFPFSQAFGKDAIPQVEWSA